MPRPHDLVVSHQSAASAWGLDLVGPPDVAHFTIPRGSSKRVVADARLHRAVLPACDVVFRDGVRITTVERTVVDLVRALPLPEALAVADSALREGLCSLGRLQRRACTLTGRGSRRVARAVACADPSSGSFLESYSRGLLIQAGIPPERTQLWIAGAQGRRIGRVDFAWPSRRVVVELDGYAFHADRVRYRNDRRRLNALGLAGWLVLRFSWEDVLGHPDAVVAAVRRALYGDAAG